MTEQLREKIAQYLDANTKLGVPTVMGQSYMECYNHLRILSGGVLALIREAGYVKLPPDSAILENISLLKDLPSDD